MSSNPERLIVGISGASGAIYGVKLLEMLRETGIETHLVISKAGVMSLKAETDMTLDGLKSMATTFHPVGDVGAAIASGSFRTLGMVIAPCSIRTLGEIRSGATSSLLTRAADVTLKERRRLVLLVRETPLHVGHLRAMAEVAEMGGIIFPPVPAFYTRPNTIDDIVRQTIGRVLDQFGIDTDIPRWGEP